MRFNTGDTVTIRNDLNIGDATAEMCLCRGEATTVTDCSGSYYRLDIDQGRSDWADEMLE